MSDGIFLSNMQKAAGSTGSHLRSVGVRNDGQCPAQYGGRGSPCRENLIQSAVGKFRRRSFNKNVMLCRLMLWYLYTKYKYGIDPLKT